MNCTKPAFVYEIAIVLYLKCPDGTLKAIKAVTDTQFQASIEQEAIKFFDHRSLEMTDV